MTPKYLLKFNIFELPFVDLKEALSFFIQQARQFKNRPNSSITTGYVYEDSKPLYKLTMFNYDGDIKIEPL